MSRAERADVLTPLAATISNRSGQVQLSGAELSRYSRHLVLPEVRLAGQRRLKAARVLVVGAGGLGSPVALYLAAAGVGQIGLVDYDVVDFSNLQRQIIHRTKDVGRPKADSAAERIKEINAEVETLIHDEALSPSNALELFERYDIIVDATDNFATRYLVNDACVLLGKPEVYGSIFRFEGQASVFAPPAGPCYRCIYPEPPPPEFVPTCAVSGVLGVLPGVVGCIQATEVVKLIVDAGEPLVGRLLHYDALAMKFRELRVRRNPACPLCGDEPRISELPDYAEFAAAGPPELSPKYQIDVSEVKGRLEQREQLTLLDVREPLEWDLCRIEGAKLIPLGQLEQRLDELERDQELVAYCRSGDRAARAVNLLIRHGFKSVKNMKGGIREWARCVDPEMPVY